MFFIIPTNESIEVICSKCDKKFFQRETRTCTSINNFIHICPRCKGKEFKEKIKSIFSIFGKDKNK